MAQLKRYISAPSSCSEGMVLNQLHTSFLFALDNILLAVG